MTRRVLIAAGGTGGHIFPAVQVAQALKEIESGVELLFVGTGRPLEEKIIDRAGFRRNTIPAVPIMQNGAVGVLKFLVTAPFVFFKTYQIFRQFRPQAVCGMGGYVTVPPVILAWLLGIPTWIHEAELKPGLANKFLGFFAGKISVAFADAAHFFKKPVIHTGHPVRKELKDLFSSAIPEDAPRRLLVVGGSLGARAVDRALGALAPKIRDLNLEVFHQCREESREELILAYKEAGVVARVQDFIDDMAEALSWSDIVVSRAGAGTIMELSVANRPAILVPYPHAQGGHQRSNAMTLVDQGKGILVEEGESFEDRLYSALKVLSARSKYLEFRQRPGDARSIDAAYSISQAILNMIR